MGDWPLLLVTTLLGAIALFAWNRWRAPRRIRDPEEGVDLAIAALIGLASYVVLRLTHTGFNPGWTPNGQDNHDYFACIVAMRFGEYEIWSPARYPLYPAIVAAADAVTGAQLWRVAMEVSLATSAMLPASVFLLGRVFAARPIAIAGALLTLHLPSHLFMLGSPTDYPLAAVLYTLSFAALVLMVREGGTRRHAIAGITLALYFLATPKAFPMLLIGLLAVVLAQATARRLELRAVAAFLIPLCVAWAAFAVLDVHLFSLEDDLLGVQRAEGWFDPNLPFPDVGWHMNDGNEVGYWIPGRLGALTHLPQVLTWLFFAPVHAMTLRERLEVFLPQVSSELSMGELRLLVVASLAGTLGAWRVGATNRRNAAAVILAASIAAAHLWGQSQAPYTQRYALPILATTPVLLLALAALPTRGERGPRTALVFLPLAAAVAWVLGPSPGALGLTHITQVMEPWGAAHPPLAGLVAFRDLLEPGDVVIDASATRLMEAVLDGEPVTVSLAQILVTPERVDFSFPACAAPHRYVVLGCVNEGQLPPGDTNELVRVRLMEDTARFELIDRCTWRDRSPGLAYATIAETPAPL